MQLNEGTGGLVEWFHHSTKPPNIPEVRNFYLKTGKSGRRLKTFPMMNITYGRTKHIRRITVIKNTNISILLSFVIAAGIPGCRRFRQRWLPRPGYRRSIRGYRDHRAGWRRECAIIWLTKWDHRHWKSALVPGYWLPSGRGRVWRSTRLFIGSPS